MPLDSAPRGLRALVPPLGRLRTASLAHRPVRRLAQLLAGLVAYGVSLALLVRADLGLDPWSVLHQGLSRHLPVTIGQATIAVGALVLLLWVPLRQRPGLGTVANVVVIGLVTDATLAVLPPVAALPARGALLVAGVLLLGAATAAYIGAGLGAGPRDGLMTGLVARTGGSVRLVRTGIEAAVLLVGWLLGGTVGLGTVVFALAIGPVVHALLPLADVPRPAPLAAAGPAAP